MQVVGTVSQNPAHGSTRCELHHCTSKQCAAGSQHTWGVKRARLSPANYTPLLQKSRPEQLPPDTSPAPAGRARRGSAGRRSRGAPRKRAAGRWHPHQPPQCRGRQRAGEWEGGRGVRAWPQEQGGLAWGVLAELQAEPSAELAQCCPRTWPPPVAKFT